MGPGSHVGFPISAKNKNLVYDHTMNISAKFDSNLNLAEMFIVWSYTRFLFFGADRKSNLAARAHNVF
jgi:hypothetical protein